MAHPLAITALFESLDDQPSRAKYALDPSHRLRYTDLMTGLVIEGLFLATVLLLAVAVAELAARVGD